MSKGKARAFGQDLMRGEHKIGGALSDKPKGLGAVAVNSAADLNHGTYASRAKAKAKADGNLTWVKGRAGDALDDTSRKILAGGRKAADAQSNLNSAPPKPDWAVGTGTENMAPGTSIFDPVLCELVYRWFSPVGGVVLDPFAGGSVRGIVASKLGRQYVGHELRAEQVEANRVQGSRLCGDDAHPPAWFCGDSRGIDKTCADLNADLVFSCPPYADLEVYSDDPLDISTLGYKQFVDAYREIIAKSCARLKDDRFACFVVGEVRDKKGNYYNFVGDTVRAFQDAGLHFYNEAILITALGSLPIRAGRQFASGRKLGKTHQNILVFVKGDGKRAATACGVVDCSDALATVQPTEGDDGLQ